MDTEELNRGEVEARQQYPALKLRTCVVLLLLPIIVIADRPTAGPHDDDER